MGTIGSNVEARTVLEAYDRALAREAHHLARRPELMWQQLYNELQSDKGPVQRLIASEFGRRTSAAATPWVHRRTNLRQSLALVWTSEAVGELFDCAIGPDGGFIVTADGDADTVSLWDSAGGRQLHTLVGHRNSVFACAVSPDGSFVVSTSGDGTVKLWDPKAAREIRTLEHADPEPLRIGDPIAGITSCAVSPDCSFVVSAGDRTAKVWDPRTGRLIKTLECSDRIGACAVSPDASFVVVSHGRTLSVWDPQTGRKLMDLSGHGPEPGGRAAVFHIHDCAVSPDGSFIVSASEDGTLKLWDAASGEELRTLRGHAELRFVFGCAVAPDATLVASSGQDRTVRIWDPATGRELRSLWGHTWEVNACAVSPDGAFVVSAGRDKTIKSWDLKADDDATFDEDPAFIHDCAASPDGSFVVSAEGVLKLWDPETGELLQTLRGNTQGHRIQSCAIGPLGMLLVSGGADRTLRLWDAKTGRESSTLEGGHAGRVVTCSISPDASYIVSASDDRVGGPMGEVINPQVLKVWDPRTSRELRTLSGHRNRITDCAIGPDGSFVVSASYDKTLKIWNPHTGRELRVLEGHHSAVYGCDVSPNGSFIVSGGVEGTLKFWAPETGREIRTVAGHSSYIRDCAVTPDGNFVLTVGGDQTLRVWDASMGRAIATIPLLGQIECVAPHPSQPLAFCGDHSNIHVIALMGIRYGPLVVTAVDLGHGLAIFCPHCRRISSFEEDWRGREIECPSGSCDGRLRVNSFVVETFGQS